SQRANNVQVNIGVFAGYESKGCTEDVHSLVRRNRAAVEDALYFALSSRAIVRLSGKLLNIDSVIAGDAAMCGCGKGAPGFFRNIVADSGQKIDGPEAGGNESGIDLREPFGVQVQHYFWLRI